MNALPKTASLRRWQRMTLWTLLLFGMARAVNAYELEGIRWPANQAIRMDLELGSVGSTLLDGSTSWDQVAQEALEIWNPTLGGGVQFQAMSTGAGPAKGDGANSVFFSRTIYGQDFGDDTVGITLYRYTPGTGTALEADVIFNSAKSFNSYRGPLRRSNAGNLVDLRRVALHEFGHVLGLDHVSQSDEAIMTPAITDIDTLQADDIAGVQSIYGKPVVIVKAPVIGGGLQSGGIVGQRFVYRISATNTPDSFQAIGLPDGLTINATTGIISGAPTVAGTFHVTLTATNNGGTGTATLTLVFAYTPIITSNPSATAYVGTPFYYQITTTGQPTEYHAAGLPVGLTLDAATGLISGTPTTAGFLAVQLQALNTAGSAFLTLSITTDYDATLAVLHPFYDSYNAGKSPSGLILMGDGTLYGITYGGGSGLGGTFFKLAPDGTLTTLYNFDYTGVWGPRSLAQDRDGGFYGVSDGSETFGGGALFKLTADGALTVVGTFPDYSHGYGNAATVLQISDGNYYGTIRASSNGPTQYGGYIYQFTPDGVRTVLHEFDNTDGYCPSALIQARDGNFYGTTSGEDYRGYGTVFKITLEGVLTTLRTFSDADGIHPRTALVQGTDGNFYGTTDDYATNGTVFMITPEGAFTTLHHFTSDEGQHPQAALIEGNNGNFYGSTADFYVTDIPTVRLIFKLTPTGELTVIHRFIDYEGTSPFLSLVPDRDGNFYGAASYGGQYGQGTIFKVMPTAVPLVTTPPPTVLPSVTLAATTPQATVDSGTMAVCTLTLSAAQDHDMIVNLTIKGSGVNGTDYAPLKTTKKIKAGKTSKAIKIAPLGNLGGAAKKTVVLTLAPGDGYTVETIDKVKVKLLAP